MLQVELENKEQIIIDKIDRFMQKIEDGIDILSDSIETSFHYINRRFSKVYNAVQRVWDTHYYKPLRYLSAPFSYLPVKLWEIYKDLYIEPDPLKADGVHGVMAPMGEGKTSVVFQTLEELHQETGYGAYVSADVEKAKVDDLGKYYNHKRFEWSDIIEITKFNDKVVGIQKTRFNGHMFPNRMYDEMHRFLNPRQNRNNNYMLYFKVIIDDMLIYRHEATKRIYLISQLTMDIQFTKVCSFIHIPHMVKGISYRRWLKTGKFEKVPLKWKMKTYVPDMDGKLKLIRKWTKKVDMDILDGFETHAEKNHRTNIKYLPTNA